MLLFLSVALLITTMGLLADADPRQRRRRHAEALSTTATRLRRALALASALSALALAATALEVGYGAVFWLCGLSLAGVAAAVVHGLWIGGSRPR